MALTLEEWAALPEDEPPHLELVKGVVVAAPPAGPHHNTAMCNLAVAINWQLPETLAAVPCSEVVIDPRFPATVRAPDVLVTSAARLRENPARFDAGDVLLAIEIVSPGSRATKATGKVTLVEPATIAVDVSRLTELRY